MESAGGCGGVCVCDCLLRAGDKDGVAVAAVPGKDKAPKSRWEGAAVLPPVSRSTALPSSDLRFGMEASCIFYAKSNG